MKNTMSDASAKARERRTLEGGTENFWRVPLMTKEEIRNLDFRRRFPIRAKIWLFWWYPVFAIILGALAIIYYAVQIIKALK